MTPVALVTASSPRRASARAGAGPLGPAAAAAAVRVLLSALRCGPAPPRDPGAAPARGAAVPAHLRDAAPHPPKPQRHVPSRHRRCAAASSCRSRPSRGLRAPESPMRRSQLLPSPRQRQRSGLCPEPRALSGRPGRRTLSGRLSDCFKKFEMLRELPKCGEEARRSKRRVPDAEGPRRSAARGAGRRRRIGSGRVSITASDVGTKRDALPS